MSLRSYLDKIKPNFEEGGKFHAFQSVFEGFETFLYVPNTTAKSGTSIHDAIDSKRIMFTVVVALIPARTDTQWFHSYVYGKAEIRFVKGRLKFGGSKNNAPFPSMVVVFKSKEMHNGK
jgi:Na+-transporting NADH:ubiquinone oxidoreductase subunit NqrB